jgi:hypothetical protein
MILGLDQTQRDQVVEMAADLKQLRTIIDIVHLAGSRLDRCRWRRQPSVYSGRIDCPKHLSIAAPRQWVDGRLSITKLSTGLLTPDR